MKKLTRIRGPNERGSIRGVATIIIGFNVLLAIAAILLVYLAVFHPLGPGEPLWTLQSGAEHVWLRLSSGKDSRAYTAIQLANRRLEDLAIALTPERVRSAAAALDSALQEAVQRIEAVDGSRDALYAQLSSVLARADGVVGTVSSYTDVSFVGALKAKIAASLSAKEVQTVREIWVPTNITPKAVPFLGESLTVEEHELVFPLEGHSRVDCMQCHQNGVYKGTPSECSACHQSELAYRLNAPQQIVAKFNGILDYIGLRQDDLYQHYEGECSDCHTTYNWRPTYYDHVKVPDCWSCHEDDRPGYDLDPTVREQLNLSSSSFHYPGDCKPCHQSFDEWKSISYDHYGSAECASCHRYEAPSTHTSAAYKPACISCHPSVTAWTFDHAYVGELNCMQCHVAPSNHYEGQCSGCHVTTDWVGVFEHPTAGCEKCHTSPPNHLGGNCTSCHKSFDWQVSNMDHSRVTNCVQCHPLATEHYVGVCSDCHGATTWSEYTFNHINYSDCVNCHTDEIGVDHYIGQCSDCHTTAAWAEYTFNHMNYGDCVSCHDYSGSHFNGQCSICHATSDWSDVTLNHEVLRQEYGSCAYCHSVPTGHWPGECGSCHYDYVDWSIVQFDHTNYTNCNACHMRPPGHPRGKCSNCHTTDTWVLEATETESLVGPATETPEPTETAVPKEVEVIVKETPIPVQPPKDVIPPNTDPSESSAGFVIGAFLIISALGITKRKKK